MTEKASDPLARALSIAGFIVALLSAIFTGLSYLHTTNTQELDNCLKAERLNDEAFDILGGKPGTPWLMGFAEKLTSEEQLRITNIARRKNDEAVQLCPESHWSHELKGLILSRYGKYEEAAKSLKLSTELTDEDGWPYSDLAGVLVKLGRLEEAEAYYKKAISISPDNPSLHRNYGLFLYYEKNNREMASVYFDKSKEIQKGMNLNLEFPEY